MNFKINDNLIISSESIPFMSKDLNNLSIKVCGDLIGAVFENQVYNSNLAFNQICEKVQSSIDLKRFLRTIVGKCYIFIKDENKITIFNSSSSPGLFYKKSK